jgi:type I restriction-modification system DNA methylase subunit
MAQTNANLTWKIADLLRGPYQPNQYGDVTYGCVSSCFECGQGY